MGSDKSHYLFGILLRVGELSGHCEESGLLFFGLVKTATTRFRMKKLRELALEERGDCFRLFDYNARNLTDLLSFIWIDQNRGTLELFAPHGRHEKPVWERWRQLEDVQTKAEHMKLSTRHTQAAEAYYSTCGQIDRHNHPRENDLDLDKKKGYHGLVKAGKHEHLGDDICRNLPGVKRYSQATNLPWRMRRSTWSSQRTYLITIPNQKQRGPGKMCQMTNMIIVMTLNHFLRGKGWCPRRESARTDSVRSIAAENKANVRCANW